MSEVRLIDANALKEELESSKYIVPNDLNRLLNSEINRCIEAIDNAQTVTSDKVQALMSDYLIYRCEPKRPQGKWELHGMIYYCSECGHDCGESGDNFCHECGADLRESSEEE